MGQFALRQVRRRQERGRALAIVAATMGWITVVGNA
jgi:hypothetical protein